MQYRCNLKVAGKGILTYSDILHSLSVLFFFFFLPFAPIYSLSKCFQRYCYVPGTMQDSGARLLNRKDIVLALTEFIIG